MVVYSLREVDAMTILAYLTVGGFEVQERLFI